MKASGSACFGFLWALSLSCLCCFPSYAQAVQRPDYREKTQSLSQQIHETLGELNQQSALSNEQLNLALNDLKSSQEQVNELRTQVKDLTTSLANTNERLGDYSMKLTASELEKKRIKKQRNVSVVINITFSVLLVLYITLKIRKLIPF